MASNYSEPAKSNEDDENSNERKRRVATSSKGFAAHARTKHTGARRAFAVRVRTTRDPYAAAQPHARRSINSCSVDDPFLLALTFVLGLVRKGRVSRSRRDENFWSLPPLTVYLLFLRLTIATSCE